MPFRSLHIAMPVAKPVGRLDPETFGTNDCCGPRRDGKEARALKRGDWDGVAGVEDTPPITLPSLSLC
jgi:hypothetical protein